MSEEAHLQPSRLQNLDKRTIETTMRHVNARLGAVNVVEFIPNGFLIHFRDNWRERNFRIIAEDMSKAHVIAFLLYVFTNGYMQFAAYVGDEHAYNTEADKDAGFHYAHAARDYLRNTPEDVLTAVRSLWPITVVNPSEPDTEETSDVFTE
jgi:predicted secreted protein